MPGARLVPVAASGLALGGRERQEDALALAMPEGSDLGFAILSDGMGGHAAGDLASRLIVSEVFAELTVRCRGAMPDRLDMPALLRHSVAVANDSLRAHLLTRPEAQGMGGTLIAAVIWQGALYWASVGDSLLFLLRNGDLRRLNADHSMAPQLDLLVAKGLMSAEAARNHPQRACLTAAVAGEEIGDLDCPEAPLSLEPGDLLLLASDGVLTLSETVLQQTIAEARPAGCRAILRALLAAVAAAGDPEQDNCAAIVIELRDPEAAPAPAMPRRGRRLGWPWWRRGGAREG
jgi:serine/threonine protein phosphatase PrpC